MRENTRLARLRQSLRANAWQCLAVSLCTVLGLAIILNVQLAGEAMWFWYDILFHHGVKLYADLHIPLQPLFVLETNAWMQLFGSKCLVTEIPSLLHLLAYCAGIVVVLRESAWPDWQKAIVLAGAFVLTVQITAYRFDDFHVLADIFILYSLAALLVLARTEAIRRQIWLVAALGGLSGLTITTRLNDGLALALATGIGLLFLVPKRKLLVISLFAAVAALTVALVVKLTGDSFSAYLSSTVIKAAATKGGTGSLFADPYLLFRNALHLALVGRKWILLWCAAVCAAGALLQRYGKSSPVPLVVMQLGLAAVTFAASSHVHRREFLSGTFVEAFSILLIVVNYLLAAFVALRYALSKRRFGKRVWDAREVLVLLPLAELASASASTAGNPRQGFYSQMAMLLLLVPVLQPFRRQSNWAYPSFVTLLALFSIAGIASKIDTPYSWNHYADKPMFENRQWFRHPVYGPMYIDRDLLRFSQSICAEIDRGGANPEMLSLPYPYPNYFCGVPPWHGYVQTWFDISARSTIDHLMLDLNSAPPQWVVYQRQLDILGGQEGLYNHGQPLAQRDLDHLIMQKIATGQWQLVEKKDYLVGDGWYIIRTRP